MTYSAIIQRRTVTPANEKIMSRENYVILEGRDHPDLLVSMHRLTLSEALPASVKYNLVKTLFNRAGKDDNGNQNPLDPSGFLGYLTNGEAQKIVTCSTITIPLQYTFVPDIDQFRRFLGVLRSRKAFDGTGKRIRKSRLNEVLDDITKVREPYRGEHLDGLFSRKDEKLQITYHKFNSDGRLESVTELLDEDTLIEDRTPGISLEDWINNPTFQGLPRKNVKSGSLYYWCPKENFVARFGANSGGADLSCDEDPSDSSSSLGVRVARVKE